MSLTPNDLSHPITPPDELVEQWWHDATGTTYQMIEYIATQAARWGDDQRLEACEKWMHVQHLPGFACQLHAAMRPKPPSLKEQALRILVENGTTLDGRVELDRDDIAIINRALEALSDD